VGFWQAVGEYITQKLQSRRFQVLCAGSVFLVLGHIDQHTWLWLAAIYIGADTMQQVIQRGRP